MSSNPVVFDRPAAVRISNAVQGWEREATDATGGQVSPHLRNRGFWAEITGAYDSGTGYPWKRKKPATDGKSLVDCDPAVTGTRLFEVSGKTDASSGTKVYVYPLAVDASRSERCRNRSSEGLTVNSRCYWCGCVIAWKTTLEGEKCPLGKW